MILQINSVSKSFGTDEILNDVSIKLEERERVGVIGKNGCGKSTLLKIICGEMPYDSGNISIAHGAKIGYLKQVASFVSENTIIEEMMSVFSDVSSLENDMREIEKMLETEKNDKIREKLLKTYSEKSEMFDKNGGFTVKAKINTVLNGMGFESFDKNMKISKLSGGEKTKLSLAKLLLEEPEILLLDEPTNHLDFKTMQWLESYLKSYRGAILAVSHDRYFLDSLFTSIYEISNTHCKKYTGNYSAYLIEKEKNFELEKKNYEQQQKEIKRLEDYVAKNLVRASTTKMAQSRQKMLERMDIIENPTSEKDFKGFKFEISYPSYKDVLTVEDLSLYINGSTLLCRNINFDIKRGEKAAIIGDNGIGKSTLLKTILGLRGGFEGSFDIGRNVDISYYDQDLKAIGDGKTVFDEVYDKNPLMSETDIRTLLGSIGFSSDDIYKKTESISGGERAKLAFLLIALEKKNTLILDEPTNHLDLSAKETLDKSLKDYEGTVIFVSHDRYFLNKVATKIIELTKDGVNVFEGNYNYYLEKRNVLNQQTQRQAENKKKTNSYQEERKILGTKRSLEKRIKNAEEEISKYEEENALLNSQLEKYATDYEKCSEIYKKIEENNNNISLLFESLENCEAELESIESL